MFASIPAVVLLGSPAFALLRLFAVQRGELNRVSSARGHLYFPLMQSRPPITTIAKTNCRV